MKKRSWTKAAVAALVLSCVLVGCSRTDSSSLPSDGSATPAVPVPVETAPEPSEPAVAVPAVGATVTTEGEVQAAKDAGLGVYQTTAGANVVIDPAAPFAQAILDDARAKGGAVATGTLAGAQAEVALRNELSGRVLAATGKTPVFIVAGDSLDENGNSLGVVYTAQTIAPELKGNGSWGPTVQDALTVAQQRIAAQADPSKYEIVNLVD